MSLAISLIFFLLIAYTYVGYPLLLKVMLWIYRPRHKPDSMSSPPEEWPEVSVVLTMHNGSKLIRSKLANLALTDYPGPLTVNFALDGCTDETEQTIRAAQDEGYRFPIYIWGVDERRGKEAAIRNALPNLPGPVLMFSDADAELAPDAIRLLVSALLEEGVGVACGHEIHLSTTKTGAGAGQGAFYRYEHAIKRMQAQLTSLTYVQGGVFAMWKRMYPPSIPVGATQDGTIAFHTVLQKHRVVYVSDAKSTEPYDITASADFGRRMRTVSRAFYCICSSPKILLPTRGGWYGLHLMSSRLMRWLTIPFAVLANLALIPALIHQNPMAIGIVVCEVLWALLAIVGRWGERRQRRWKLPYFCYYFTYIHAAAFFAILKVLTGQRTAVWRPTPLKEESAAPTYDGTRRHSQIEQVAAQR